MVKRAVGGIGGDGTNRVGRRDGNSRCDGGRGSRRLCPQAKAKHIVIVPLFAGSRARHDELGVRMGRGECHVVDLEVLVVPAQWRWTFVVEESGVGRLVGKCGTKRPVDDCKWEEWGMDLPRSGCVGRHARWACMGRTPPPPNGPGRRTPLPAASHQALHASRAYWHLLRCQGVPVPLDAHKQCPALASCGTRAASLTVLARHCSYRTAPFIPPTPCRESILFASLDPLHAILRGTRWSNPSCGVVGGPNGSFLSKHVHVCEI